MKKRQLLGIILITLLMLVGNIFGLDLPAVSFNANNQVVVSGQTQPLADVNIVIAKQGKRYFLDTVVSDSKGAYQFITKLPQGEVYEVILSSQDQVVQFQLTTDENVIVVDKSKLQAVIVEAKQKEASKYTQDSWKNLENILAQAQKVYENSVATQQEVNEATYQLESALKALVPLSTGGGGGGGTNPQNKSVTLSIDKLTINKGYVLTPTKVSFESGDTVWDVLQRELDQRGIDYDYSLTHQYNSVYVESIDGDGEFDHGPGSGWMYSVNGEFPEYGASLYKVSAGDTIAWRYTTNLGEDLGETPSGGLGGGMIENTLEVPNVADAKVKVPEQDHQTYHIHLTKALDQLRSLQVDVPQNNSKVFLNIEDTLESLPAISINRGAFALQINKGTKITGKQKQIGLFNPESTEKIADLLAEQNLQNVSYYRMHSSDEWIEFSEPVTMTIQKGSAQQIAWVNKDGMTAIPVYANKQQAEQIVVEKGLESYAYQEGEQLVVWTNRMTSMITYTDEQQDSYKDFDAISDWAKQAVMLATEKGIISGYEGYFNPKQSVTRAEFVKMLLHAMYGDNIQAEQSAPFKDVTEQNWFSSYVDMAYEKGIVQGEGDYFKPNETITREQMAVMLVRALELEPQQSKEQIKDFDSISDWAKEQVQTAYSHGLINGVEGSFLPKQQATREMAIVVIMRGYSD